MQIYNLILFIDLALLLKYISLISLNGLTNVFKQMSYKTVAYFVLGVLNGSHV